MRNAVTILFLAAGVLVSSYSVVCAADADELRVLMMDARGANMAMQFEDAIQFCDKAIELDPNLAQAYAERSDARSMMGDVDGARADIEKAISLDPDSPQVSRAYFIKSVLLLTQDNDLEGALTAVNKAIELNTGDYEYYQARGEIYNALGEEDLADVDFDKSMQLLEELYPDN